MERQIKETIVNKVRIEGRVDWIKVCDLFDFHAAIGSLLMSNPRDIKISDAFEPDCPSMREILIRLNEPVSRSFTDRIAGPIDEHGELEIYDCVDTGW